MCTPILLHEATCQPKSVPVKQRCLDPAGILVAQLVNYGTHRIPDWGWRLSLASAGLPALVLLVGSVFLPDR